MSGTKKKIFNWTAIGTVIAGVAIISTLTGWTRNALSVWDTPSRIDKLEPRVTALETVNLTNSLTVQYRFDRVDEKMSQQSEKLDALIQYLKHQTNSIDGH